MTEKESVEALAERIAEWVNERVFTDLPIYSTPIANLIREWQPTEKQQPMQFTINEGEIKYTDVVLNVDRGEYTLTRVDYEATNLHGMRIEVPCDGRERPYSIEILFPAEALSRFVAELTAMQIERNAEKQQPADDAHREIMQTALAELRAEAARCGSFTASGKSPYRNIIVVTSRCLISSRSHAALEHERVRCGATEELRWPDVHDAIARANNLPTLAEIEAENEPEADVEQLQKSMDEFRSGKSRDVQEIIDEFEAAGAEVHVIGHDPRTPQPAEPVVTDEDRELASKVICAIEAELSQRCIPSLAFDAVKSIIAKARQAERDTAAAWESRCHALETELAKQDGELQQLKSAIDIRRADLQRECDALQAKLTAAEASIRDLDELYQRERDIAGRALVEVGVCTRTMQDSASTLQRMAQASLDKFCKQPATADAKGGSDVDLHAVHRKMS